MKRSEMVQKYTDILKMYGYPKDNGFMPRAKLADMMLQVAENNGMKPPTIFDWIETATVTDVNAEAGLVRFTKGPTWGTVNKWEDENET